LFARKTSRYKADGTNSTLHIIYPFTKAVGTPPVQCCLSSSHMQSHQ